MAKKLFYICSACNDKTPQLGHLDFLMLKVSGGKVYLERHNTEREGKKHNFPSVLIFTHLKSEKKNFQQRLKTVMKWPSLMNIYLFYVYLTISTF